MVILENMQTIADNTSGKEFHDDVLPILGVGLSSSTHAVVGASLSTLSSVTPKLDYTTIKNELFPVVAGVFSSTNSLAIKIQGLEAFFTLCGGVDNANTGLGDGLDGTISKQDDTRKASSAVLDKFTIQEKIVPLLKGIKTKEPAVMMAALKVFRQVGKVSDVEYLATNVLPVLWSFALGPLLDLNQFQSFMSLIKSISGHIEREHSRKLQELNTSNVNGTSRTIRNVAATQSDTALSSNGEELDFESLVSGRKDNSTPDIINDWSGAIPSQRQQTGVTSNSKHSLPTMTSRPLAFQQTNSLSALRPQDSTRRTVTPDQSLSSFASLAPNNAFNQPLQPSRPGAAPRTSSATMQPLSPRIPTSPAASTIDWSTALKPSNAPASSTGNLSSPSAFGILPPPSAPRTNSSNGMSGFNISSQAMRPQTKPQQTSQATFQAPQTGNGLDKYESLL